MATYTEQLISAGILTTAPAQNETDMINDLTPAEFQTILSVYARLSPTNKKTFAGIIYTMGF